MRSQGDEPTDNLLRVRELVEAWNSHDLERIGAFFHADFENHQLPLPPVIGRAAYLEHCKTWFHAYPDFRIEVLTLFGDGDLVCLESRATGTRAADFFGAEASGVPETNYALDLLEFRDGLVIRERGYWDYSVLTGRPAPSAGGPGDPRSPFTSSAS
jgi:predicted ester cyclase